MPLGAYCTRDATWKNRSYAHSIPCLLHLRTHTDPGLAHLFQPMVTDSTITREHTRNCTSLAYLMNDMSSSYSWLLFVLAQKKIRLAITRTWRKRTCLECAMNWPDADINVHMLNWVMKAALLHHNSRCVALFSGWFSLNVHVRMRLCVCNNSKRHALACSI